jgi:tripeptide aminopeptidase
MEPCLDNLTNVQAELQDVLVTQTLAICRIPSPTFAEEKRAQYIAGRLRELDLRDVEIDSISNVTALLPSGSTARPLMVVAHIDTVFPEGTNVEPNWDGQYWRAPGIRDNSASVATTLLLPELLRRAGVKLRRDLILAFSVGEEGRGNLRGMRALMERFGDRVFAVIAADGNLGVINHVAISVRRLEISVKTDGGHSWADAGKPSAVHVLARIAGRISELSVPSEPKTVINIGTVSGGTSVNSIAEFARLSLDIRSIDGAEVRKLENAVRDIVAALSDDRVVVEIAEIGDRPGGMIPRDHSLVRAMIAGYASAGVKPTLLPGSTDANIPLSLGIPSASMGISQGGRIHTLQEYLDPQSLPAGAAALVHTLASLQEES